MSASFEIDTLELEAFQAAIEHKAGTIARDARRITNQYATLIVKEAKRRVPVDTGDLKRSIHKTGGAREGAGVVADMPYAGFVEYGTSRTRPQPYLGPAFAMYRKDYIEDLKQAAASLIGRGGIGAVTGQRERFSLEQQLVAGQFRR